MTLTKFGKESHVQEALNLLGFKEGRPRRILEKALIKKLSSPEIEALAYLAHNRKTS